MKDLWENYFNKPYPYSIKCMAQAGLYDLDTNELEGFIQSLKDRNIKWREINLFTGMVIALIRVYKWCLDNKVNEFDRKDIKDKILLTENESARWGDWILFGAGMVYKPEGKGSWGLNMGRVKEFLDGKRQIPIKIAKRGKEISILQEAYINQIPNLSELLSKDLKYLVNYWEGEINNLWRL